MVAPPPPSPKSTKVVKYDINLNLKEAGVGKLEPKPNPNRSQKINVEPEENKNYTIFITTFHLCSFSFIHLFTYSLIRFLNTSNVCRSQGMSRMSSSAHPLTLFAVGNTCISLNYICDM